MDQKTQFIADNPAVRDVSVNPQSQQAVLDRRPKPDCRALLSVPAVRIFGAAPYRRPFILPILLLNLAPAGIWGDPTIAGHAGSVRSLTEPIVVNCSF